MSLLSHLSSGKPLPNSLHACNKCCTPGNKRARLWYARGACSWSSQRPTCRYLQTFSHEIQSGCSARFVSNWLELLSGPNSQARRSYCGTKCCLRSYLSRVQDSTWPLKGPFAAVMMQAMVFSDGAHLVGYSTHRLDVSPPAYIPTTLPRDYGNASSSKSCRCKSGTLSPACTNSCAKVFAGSLNPSRV
ncbi:hypothetical protein AUEXF2481DRAFT_41949 [Aureobasidium subglaciale EXF-2481]|uniref:Uncharacterized protein n=1 Tax=Aureobasidium subglaciale (strain EXF-2481) TaxID=1043005 RepID=A0A074Y624_AURSE|nr:uncharacterized protein AUEXF2481DRAFT_41949 [Aureobasidium subglaciale EXF-2481]KAI5194915.1 hypothetical protein E4T38_09324 [Aureobasidium subglaciale]KAI5213993.1 hypothetical protein E4T40_09275 [Aureobasidium subglaciale]KAI5216407.1 hypothetical protein E4T41_09276 [Aureobasidium subglaciale]KAI5254205.1 hypothetical protein E4T46_09231 [Aureobasidium subglaciale]KEQ93228.1 hypothetical protein AUEXF2481DRAFT_41949 [Aureobasidium subglaciale EXF-2481]